MIIGCNIWMICLELNWFFYDPSRMLHLSEFVWALRSSVWVVFNNFLLIDTTDRSKISSNHSFQFSQTLLLKKLEAIFTGGIVHQPPFSRLWFSRPLTNPSRATSGHLGKILLDYMYWILGDYFYLKTVETYVYCNFFS